MTEKGIDCGPPHCGACGGEVIRKSRLRLGASGAIMIAGAAAGFVLWSRQCKRIARS
ncbi:MAG: hypothetical protein ABW221_23135 [Vicinamibacteria bacterium]